MALIKLMLKNHYFYKFCQPFALNFFDYNMDAVTSQWFIQQKNEWNKKCGSSKGSIQWWTILLASVAFEAMKIGRKHFMYGFWPLFFEGNCSQC